MEWRATHKVILIYLFMIYVLVYVLLNLRIRTLGIRQTSIQSNYKTLIIIALISMVLILGLRSSTVGTDTYGYETSFLSMRNKGYSLKGLFVHLKVNNFRDPLYDGTVWLLIRLGFNSAGARMFFGILSVVPVILLIYKKSKSYLFSIFIFFSFGFFAFDFSGVRQAVAIGFCILAYLAMDENKWLLYMLFCAMAIGFHFSAAIFLPAVVFRRLKVKKNTILLFLLAATITLVFSNNIVSFLAELIGKDYSSDIGGGTLFSIFLLGTVVMEYIFRRRELACGTDTISFWMGCMAVLIFTLSKSSAVYMRMALYYEIFMIVNIPNLIKARNSAVERYIISCCYIVVGVFYFITYVLYGYKITPYSLFWSY